FARCQGCEVKRQLAGARGRRVFRGSLVLAPGEIGLPCTLPGCQASCPDYPGPWQCRGSGRQDYSDEWTGLARNTPSLRHSFPELSIILQGCEVWYRSQGEWRLNPFGGQREPARNALSLADNLRALGELDRGCCERSRCEDAGRRKLFFRLPGPLRDGFWP